MPTEDPEFLELASGNETVVQNKLKKKILQTKQQIEKDKELDVGKSHIDAIPNEVILLADQTMIRNFEVDF